MTKSIIKLNDLLQLSDSELNMTKIRFMVPSGDFDPQKDAKDESKYDLINLQHLVWNNKKINISKDMIAIGFIGIHDDYWLMTGIVSIINDNGPNNKATAKYLNKKFNFRLVIRFHKTERNGCLWAKEIIDKLEVVELWNPDKTLEDKSFPGYKNVKIDYEELKKKLKTSDEWQTALSCRKGVYVIADKLTGKLYVGSAYGKNGILGRWNTYIKSGYDCKEVENGNYPNKQFRALVRKNGLKYVKDNFQYSILETFTDDVTDEYIIERESWWKDVLLTRGNMGYNSN